MRDLITVKLRQGMLGAPIGRHPWVRREAIASVSGKPRDGDEAVVTGPDGKFIARGFYHTQSSIAVRLYAWKDIALDPAFFEAKLDQALALRESLGFKTDCRLVYSEGDGISGLTIDRFGEYVVIQATSLAIFQRIDAVIAWCERKLKPPGIVLRVPKSIAAPEGMEPVNRIASGKGPEEPNGLA